MKRYYIETFGCQMNVHDSEKMAGILRTEGYTAVGSAKDADIVIFNTCSIRQKAEQKFFSELGRIKSLKKRRPGLKIAVAGCIAQQEGSKILKRASYVDYVIGPQNIPILKNIITSDSNVIAVEDNPSITEAYLPVQGKTLMSRRDTKDNENPPSPPFAKGGMDGFLKQKGEKKV